MLKTVYKRKETLTCPKTLWVEQVTWHWSEQKNLNFFPSYDGQEEKYMGLVEFNSACSVFQNTNVGKAELVALWYGK